MSWITESNRQKHFLYAPYLVPFYSRFYSYGGKWDWLDLLATILGGVLGQMLQILLIYALRCVS